MGTSDSAERPTLGELYDREFAFVWRTVRRLGVAEADVPDAVHDVFSVLVRRWPEYDPSRALRGWIFGIARLVAVASRRRTQQRQETDEPWPPASGPTPEDTAADRQLLRLLLEGLDEDRRCVFILHDLEGFSGPEISETLGIPLNTVYSRLRVVREELAAQVVRMRLRRAV